MALPPANEDGPSVREIIWGVDTKIEIEDIAAALSTVREVSINNDDSIHTQDDSGNWIGFKPAEVTLANVPEVKLDFYEKIKRVNETGWPEDRA